MKHTFSGLCRGGPLDGQSLEYHQNVYRILEPASYELLGEYWHQDAAGHPSQRDAVPKRVKLYGFFYEISSGKLTEVLRDIPS
jgi:hypothetical protein